MTTQISDTKRSLPPLPPVRRNLFTFIKPGPLLIFVLLAGFLCYPATLIGRGLVISAYLKQGDDALEHGRWVEARTNFNSAMGWSLSNEAPFDKRWSLALRSDDIETAVNDFSAQIADHPGRYMGYCYRADAYRELDRNKEALQDYRACLAHEPSNIWRQSSRNMILFLESKTP